MSLRCSICGKPFELDDSPALPFCSHRCRLIDLGRWLDEGYGMAIEREEEADEEPPSDDDQS
jgi:hypothetical protein